MNGTLNEKDTQAFKEGMKLSDDFTAMPAELEILNAGMESECLVTIREGKFHQIRRMFHLLGKEVLYLKRLSFGPLKLDETLSPGEYRRLTEDEVAELKQW